MKTRKQKIAREVIYWTVFLVIVAILVGSTLAQVPATMDVPDSMDTYVRVWDVELLWTFVYDKAAAGHSGLPATIEIDKGPLHNRRTEKPLYSPEIARLFDCHYISRPTTEGGPSFLVPLHLWYQFETWHDQLPPDETEKEEEAVDVPKAEESTRYTYGSKYYYRVDAPVYNEYRATRRDMDDIIRIYLPYRVLGGRVRIDSLDKHQPYKHGYVSEKGYIWHRDGYWRKDNYRHYPIRVGGAWAYLVLPDKPPGVKAGEAK